MRLLTLSLLLAGLVGSCEAMEKEHKTKQSKITVIPYSETPEQKPTSTDKVAQFIIRSYQNEVHVFHLETNPKNGLCLPLKNIILQGWLKGGFGHFKDTDVGIRGRNSQGNFSFVHITPAHFTPQHLKEYPTKK